MSTEKIQNLTITQAEKILNEFTCQEMKLIKSPEEKNITRSAILLLANLSDYQILGICADSKTEALSALDSYLEALGYNTTLLSDSNFNSVDGSIYLKFNGMKDSYFMESYTGKYRGVLVSCQSAETTGVNGTYGYFPLDLFS
ncbi:MAG: DUF1824 family protein [Trichodesmium sp.]